MPVAIESNGVTAGDKSGVNSSEVAAKTLVLLLPPTLLLPLCSDISISSGRVALKKSGWKLVSLGLVSVMSGPSRSLSM